MALVGTLHTRLRDDAVRHLTAGTSVDFQGPSGSGCSLLARSVCAELEDAGWHVVKAQGIAALADRPLEALSIAGLVARQGGPSGPPTAVSAAVQGILAAVKGSTVLFIDDVDDLDEMSAGAITAAHRITPFPILSTSRPTPRPQRPAWRITAAIRPGVVLKVPPLGFVDTQTLVSEVLGAPIDASSFARLFATSGGVPSLTSQIINTARMRGVLKLVDDVWTANSELWLPEMGRAVEPLLQHLSPEAIDGLHALALAGTIDIKTAHKFVPWEVLEEIDGYGLLQFLPRGDETLISVFPQAVAEFFKHHTVGARELRVDKMVTGAFGDDSDFRPRPSATGWSHTLPGDPSTLGALPITNDNNEGLVENRLLVDHWHRELLLRRAEWEQNPTPRTATALIRTTLVTGADKDSLIRVIEGTPRTGDHRDLVSYDNWCALFVGVVEHNMDWAHAIFTQSRVDAEEWSELSEAIQDFIELQTEYCPNPDDLDTPPDTAPEDTKEIVAAVRAELFLARGRPDEALLELERLKEPKTEFGRLRTASLPWALLLEGEDEAAITAAREALAAARHKHDIEGIMAAAYVLAIGLIIRGRASELRAVLSSVLSAGILPAMQRPQHVALLSIAAQLAAEEGRTTTARSLAQQALSLQPGPGLLPLGSPTQALAELDLAELPPVQARAQTGDRLWAESEDLLKREYLVAGYLCGVLGYIANPLHERAVILQEIAQQIPAPFIKIVDKMVVALDSDDPDVMVAAADLLADQGRVFEAATTYSAALNHLRNSGNAAKAAKVHDAAKKRLSVWGAEAANGLRSAADGADLTAREEEIARLAASGLPNQEIARRLLISVRTVENHLHRVFRKLGVENRAGMSRVLAG
ncbi:MAG: LuxR family transcriptional regulator [Cellulomonadaceae bacterium]|jgi:DNA-binding NarL/FixJ family response regulator|nr:LuxR family transcriptional regulator [Cellulomonadaceae bacterium]